MAVNRSLGVSIAAFRPTIDVLTPLYTPTGMLVTDQLGQLANSYTQEILANGGYWSATINLSGSRTEMDWWYESALGLHIEADADTVRIWEGFVNQVSYSVGSIVAVRGPLIQAVNRASVTYTPVLDATGDPPLLGVQQSTTGVDHTASRAKYGVLEGILSQGQLLDDGTTDEAAQIRDTFLAENALPESSEDLGIGSTSQPMITLECLGYVHRFMRYVVQDLTTATVQISNNDGTGKLQLAIAEDPNGMFPASYGHMENNGFLTSRYENTNRMAWDVMTGLVSVGDVNDDRYLLGVYDGRLVHYNAMPSTVEYQHRISGQGLRFEKFGTEQEVTPWMVRPGKWSFLPDFLVGRENAATPREDPRNVFIESVRFTAPWDVQISGGKYSRLSQMLAKIGMRS